MKRHLLSKKDIKLLMREVDQNIRKVLENADNVELYEVDEKLTLYIVDGKPLFAKMKVKIEDKETERYVPLITLFYTTECTYPYVNVDDGAVPRILNGADVMRPGVKNISGEFDKGDIVAVRDLKNRTIAVTIALYSKNEIENMQKGKILKNIHYLGDKITKICTELSRKS